MNSINLLGDIADLLERRAGDSEGERRALLREAFFGTNAPLGRIPDERKPRVFAVNCLAELFDFGQLADGRHAVVVLLEHLRRNVLGGEDQREAASLIRQVEDAHPSQRTRELRHLEALLERRAIYVALYTPLSGEARADGRPRKPAIRATVMRPEYEWRRLERMRPEMETAAMPEEVTRSDDIRKLVTEGRSAVLLGEPGAGKTTSLWELAQERAEVALTDHDQPVPVMVALGNWLDATEPLEAFIARQMGEGEAGLSQDLPGLRDSKRVSFLLDGLNELPVGQRADKAGQVRDFIQRHRGIQVLVSCRDLDYNADKELDLAVDRITIQPLSPTRVLEFITKHLTDGLQEDEPDAQRRVERGKEDAERFFWELAGGKDVFDCWWAWKRAGASLDLFWSADSIPDKRPNVYQATTGEQDMLWEHKVRSPGNLIRLAANPYMLHMLVDVYDVRQGEVPANRGELFDLFVEQLLEREGLDPEGPEAHGLCAAIGAIALAMQRGGGAEIHGDDGVSDDHAVADSDGEAKALTLTALPREFAIAQGLGTEGQLRQAAGASILSQGRQLRFTHQLLQEYFAARGMREQIQAGTLAAATLWPPEAWWATTGWEEATVLLAGLHSNDCSQIILWVEAANPLLAARCILNSGAEVPRETLLLLRQRWLARMTDSRRERLPDSRAAIGRALAMLTVDEDGEQVMLDNRPGVGVYRDKTSGRQLPDIDWVLIPGGPFTYQKGEKGERELILPPFRIARYSVTWIQFQTFVEDPDGYGNMDWWEGLEKRTERPGAARWPIANHPRETVDWDEAVAFGRWLTARLSGAGMLGDAEEARLPTEEEWERAARGTEGREYPWGAGYRSGLANIDETARFGGDKMGEHFVGRTSAVGMYRDGATPAPEGVHDMAGNVWEWCLNEYKKPERILPARVVRGGSWSGDRHDARASCRGRGRPYGRNNGLGFRLVISSPISPVPLAAGAA